MTLNELIQKYPRLNFIHQSRKFHMLPSDKQEFVIGLIEDAMFWIELEEKPNATDGFKFLAAAYGLDQAQKEADAKGLAGKDREKFIRPHQDLYTMYNPYSGNAREDVGA